MTNHSGGPITEFDVMFNKNPFGVAIYNSASAFSYPSPGQTARASIPCTIDKKNLDAKNPPKFPFNIQTALKSSLDLFYFEVPCYINCLLDFAHPMTREDFKKFWEMIPKANETALSVDPLYPGFTQSGDVCASLIEGMKNNGFENLAKIQKPDGQTTVLYFGAKTINNLPLLLEIAYSGGKSAQVLYKVPVLPLKPLLAEAIEHILARKE